MISRSAVWNRVFRSWFFTISGIIGMLLIGIACAALASRFLGPRVLIPMFFTTTGSALLLFGLSEAIINAMFRATPADAKTCPHLIAAWEELFRRKSVLIRPRLRILQLDQPNAMAYGWGIFGQASIGVTRPLLNLLSKEELMGVLGHELGHVRCWDVGVMTVVSMVTSGSEQISNLFIRGKTALAKGPMALLIGLLFLFIARILTPIGRSAISREREYTADALSALYLGTPEPLIAALGKLEKERKSSDGLFADLLISHPGTAQRIDALRSLSASSAS